MTTKTTTSQKPRRAKKALHQPTDQLLIAKLGEKLYKTLEVNAPQTLKLMGQWTRGEIKIHA